MEDNEVARKMFPWVRRMAQKVVAGMPSFVEVDDLVQEGMIALIKAIPRFEEARGIKFETFVERRVQGAMIDALRRQSWSRGLRRMRREIIATREMLERELGRWPEPEEIAQKLGISREILDRRIRHIEKLESTTQTEGSLSFLEGGFIPKESISPLQPLIEEGERDRLRAAIKTLSPRDRRVITLYYFRGLTQKQIGQAIGIGESRVCQIRTEIIRRLRTILEDPAAKAAVAA